MDIRNADIPPLIEHGGTCLSYQMVPKESMRAETMGGYLEVIGEFELAGSDKLEPHRHDTDEFFYVLRGRAVMEVEGEQAEVGSGDLIHIPRNAVHSIWDADGTEAFRALGFSISYMPEGGSYEPVGVEVEG